MVKISCCLLLLLFPGLLHAQVKKYFISFTDKQNSNYTVAQPEKFLSQRAINRRINQSIPIIENDLPVNQWYVDSLVNFGFTLLGKSKWFNGAVISTEDSTLINQISNWSFIKSTRYFRQVNTNYEKFSFFDLATSQRSSLQLMGTILDYGQSQQQVSQIGCDCLHEQNFTGKNISIAVLDAGFPNCLSMLVLDSMNQQGRLLGGFDFVENNNAFAEDHWHGSAVLSTMAALNEGSIIGTAPHASYWLLRSEDAATENIIEEYNWVIAAEFADSVGADIINSSLGYTTFDDPTQNHTYSTMDGDQAPASIGADLASSKGILVVCSAGNSGASAWKYIGAPSDGDSVLAIGAVDEAGTLGSFSSRGPAPDGAVKPNVVAMGVNATVSDPNDQVTTSNGTSFSSPILAGAAACLWQAFPEKNNMAIKRAIEESADKFLNPDGEYGYGLPDMCKAQMILSGKSTEDIKQDQLWLYPNPNDNILSVVFLSEKSQSVLLRVSDYSGKTLLEENIDTRTGQLMLKRLAINDLASAVYFVQVISPEKTISARFIKN